MLLLKCIYSPGKWIIFHKGNKNIFEGTGKGLGRGREREEKEKEMEQLRTSSTSIKMEGHISSKSLNLLV